MTDILSWISWLGLGGVAGIFAAAYLLPSLLPAVAVGLLKGAVETVAGVVQTLFGSILLPGAQHIFANRAAVATLIFGVVAGAWAGDRYEFVRPYIPEWMRSEPGQVTQARAQEAAKHKARPKQQAAQKAPQKSAWDEFACGLGICR